MEQEVEIRLKVVTLQDVKQLQKISMETFSDTFKEANDEANLKDELSFGDEKKGEEISKKNSQVLGFLYNPKL